MYLSLRASIYLSESRFAGRLSSLQRTPTSTSGMFMEATTVPRLSGSNLVVSQSAAESPARSLRLSCQLYTSLSSLPLALALCLSVSALSPSLSLSLSFCPSLHAALTVPVICFHTLFLCRPYGLHWSKRRPSRPHRRRPTRSSDRDLVCRWLRELDVRCLQSRFGQGRHCKASQEHEVT